MDPRGVHDNLFIIFLQRFGAQSNIQSGSPEILARALETPRTVKYTNANMTHACRFFVEQALVQLCYCPIVPSLPMHQYVLE